MLDNLAYVNEIGEIAIFILKKNTLSQRKHLEEEEK